MSGYGTGTSKTVKLVDSPPAGQTVSRIIGQCGASDTVSYWVLFVRDSIATVEISGPVGDVERVVNWGIMDRVW